MNSANAQISEQDRVRHADLVAGIEVTIRHRAKYFATLYRVDCADDLAQVGRLSALRAAKHWRADGGSSFAHFAGLWFERDMRCEAKRLCNIVHIPLAKFATEKVSCISLDTPIGDGEDDDETVGSRFVCGGQDSTTIVDRAILVEAVRSLIDNLPLRKQQVLKGRFFQGKTFQQLAREIGITRQGAQKIERGVLEEWSKTPAFQRQIAN